MDYLHYMQFEQENFNLIVGPMVIDMYSWQQNEKSETGWLDYFMATSSISIRFMLLIGFLFNLQNSTKGMEQFWKVYFIILFVIFWVTFILYFVLSKGEAWFNFQKCILEPAAYALLDDSTKAMCQNNHQNVRVAMNHSEIVAIPILIMFHIYLQWFMKAKYSKVQDKSAQIILQRRNKFDEIIFDAEKHFLDLHNIPEEDRQDKLVK